MISQSPTPELPVLHRLTIGYLMLPVCIWLLGWFHWWLGIPATALLVAGFWRTLGGSWRETPRPATFAALLMSLGWVLMTAAGGFLDVNNGDWIKHRAILTDLARYAWPVYVPDPLVAFLSPETHARQDALLRYYLGYYVVPGLAGRWFGLAALNWAVPLWTWGGVALLVLLFTRCFARTGATIVAAVVLIGFGGMDFLRIVLLSGEVVPLFDSAHIETDDFLIERILYSSNMASLMWAPQHFLTGGLYTMLLVQLRSQPRFLASSGLLLAACLFWSPFVAVGLLPLVAVLFLDNGPRPFLRWQNFLAVPLAGLLVAYLTSDAGNIIRGWLWEKSDWGEMIYWLPVFYLTEFVVLSLLLWRCRPQMREDRFFLVSVGTLLILPVYTYGYFNDLGMRASLPALLILCWYCADVVSNPKIGPLRRQRKSRTKRRKRPAVRRATKKTPAPTTDPETRRNRTRLALVCMLVTVLVVGTVSPLHELTRAYENVGTFRYHQHLLSSISTNIPRPAWSQHVADDVPAALRGVLKAGEDTRSGDGRWEFVVRSAFDVYRNGKLLLYTKTPCMEEEDLEPVFFVDVWPQHVRDLPEHRQRHGFDNFLYADLRLHALWLDERCAFLRTLPEYDIARVATGQFKQGRRAWRGEFSLAPP